MGQTAQAIVESIEAECRQRGWTIAELERQAGIARGTFYRMKRGETETPRASTLRKVADALKLEVEDLLRGGSHIATADRAGRTSSTSVDPQRKFDRVTNPAVAEVAREQPELFADWSPDDWDELYSTFGTGGALSPEGVRTAAQTINRKRETVHRLQVVLETHLRDVAVELVDALFRLVQAQGPDAMRTPPPDAPWTAQKPR